MPSENAEDKGTAGKGEGAKSGPLRDAALAVAFLTVVPVPERLLPGGGSFGRIFSWFPLVGLLLGGMLSVSALLLVNFMPATAVAALLIALWVALTGGLHLDGLMDASDGLLCSKEAEERLAVMADSRVGAFGVLGAVCVLLVKFAALFALLEGGAFFAALVVSPVLARWAMTLAVVAFPYRARGETLGSAFVGGVGGRQLLFASATAVAVMIGVAYLSGGVYASVSAALVAGAVTVVVARFAVRRVGGLTGDVYGATGEIVEVAVLLTFVAFAGSPGSAA